MSLSSSHVLYRIGLGKISIVLLIAVASLFFVTGYFLFITFFTHVRPNSVDFETVEGEYEQPSDFDDSSGKLTEVTPTSLLIFPIDVQWQDDQLSYDVQQAILVLDQDNQVLPESLSGGRLIIFAVQATDTRTFGAPRVVPARNYVNIRRQSQDFPPLGQDTQQLEPGQTTTVYVPFAAPESEQKITGLLGNLRNPYVVELDFSQGQLFEGTFDPILGFQTTLEVQATPIP